MYDRMQDLLICGDGNEKAEVSGKQTHENPWSSGNEICQICGFWWVTPAHDHHFYHHYPHYSYATLELHNFHFASKGGVRKGERGLTTG